MTLLVELSFVIWLRYCLPAFSIGSTCFLPFYMVFFGYQLIWNSSVRKVCPFAPLYLTIYLYSNRLVCIYISGCNLMPCY